MIDSTKMLSIGISISKKLDGSKLKKSNIQCTCLDALEELPLKKNTIVITNPPYGLRVKNTNNERKGFFIKCFINIKMFIFNHVIINSGY